jgi:hypothetical protein
MTNNKQQTAVDFVRYELALELKQLGFDEPCLGYYLASSLFISNDNVYNSTDIPVIKAPLYSQAFRWFREKYNLHALIMPKTTPSNTTVYYIYKGKFEENWDNCFEAYEEAELRCLKHLIKTVKENENQI